MSETEIIKKTDNSELNNKKDKKKKIKLTMPSALAIIVAILFGLVIISWIVAWSGGGYESTNVISIMPGINDPISMSQENFKAFEAFATSDAEMATVFTYTHEMVGSNVNVVITNLTPITVDLSIPDWSSEVAAMGIFGVGVAMGYGFVSGSDLIFYLFILGAIIELMLVSGSLEAGISGLVKGFSGKELLLIPILVILFSAGGTIYGMSEETIALFVIVVPVLALAGFDTTVGMMVILGGTATGCAMSTVNPFAIGAASGAINDIFDYNQGVTLFLTLGWWVVLTGIVASLITGYAWYVKKNPEKSVNKQMKNEADEWLKGFEIKDDSVQTTGRQKGALGVFMFAFVLMILLFVPWADIIPGFDYSTGDKDPFFGLIATLGTWYFAELSMLFLVAGAIIAKILNMGSEKTSNAMWAGAKDMLSVAIIIGVARGIPYIMETTGLQIFFVSGLINSLSNITPLAFLYVSFFILLALAVVITSTSGLAAATMGLFAAAVMGFTNDATVGSAWYGINAEAYMGAIVIAYIMAAGVLNFFTPTNPIVMVSMSSSKVAYTDGVKVMAPIAGIVLLVTVAFILPSTMILWA